MDFNHRLSISYYKTIAVINEAHQIFLVQHQETKKVFVKKILDVYNADVYVRLFNNHIIGTPKIIDHFINDENKLIIIEEFISGCSLQEKIENQELTITDILSYMLDLCDILDKLHSQIPAIIHRDIKPSNVIISSYNRAVLLDFNAAKFYCAQATEDTTLLGTQGYAAPEQYGFGSSSPQTDIYSLGILIREMTASISYYSPEIHSIISKCTQINPAQRYISAKELRQDILALAVNKDAKATLPVGFAKFIPPGFRTKTPWKMFSASFGYLLITYLSLSLEVKNAYGPVLWIERIFSYALLLSIVFGCFNYLNIQQLMPLCQHKNRFVRYLGIFILNFCICFGLFILLTIVETTCFPA